ncbi:MAG: hypothetical protein ACOCXA_06565 [Planctomycetota bacterium]
MSTARPAALLRRFALPGPLCVACILALAACGGGGGGGGDDELTGPGNGDDVGAPDDQPGDQPVRPRPEADPIRFQEVEIGPVADGQATVTVRADGEGLATIAVSAIGHKGVARVLPSAGIPLQAGNAGAGSIFLSHVGDYRVTVTLTNGGEPQTDSTIITADGPGHVVDGEVLAQGTMPSGVDDLVTDVVLEWQPDPSLDPIRVGVASATMETPGFRFEGLATAAPTFRTDIQPTVAP